MTANPQRHKTAIELADLISDLLEGCLAGGGELNESRSRCDHFPGHWLDEAISLFTFDAGVQSKFILTFQMVSVRTQVFFFLQQTFFLFS